MAAKSSLVCFFQEKDEKLEPIYTAFVLNGLDFLVFSFSSCSREIRLLQCLRFGLPDATLNALTFRAIIRFRF